jgi:cytochrome c oxidase cbb3-type subunit III
VRVPQLVEARFPFLVALCALLLSVPAHLHAQKSKQGADSSASARASLENGRQLFESTCATCHGLDGRGAERGPNIATRPEVRRRSDAEISGILQRGVPAAGMPSFGALGAAKLKSITAYLRSLQGLDHQVLVSGDAAKGKELFFAKGSCADCHMVNGTGGFLGSDLSIYGGITSVEQMREQIANHDQSPRTRIAAVSTHDGQTFTGFARNEDNFSLQLQSLDGKFHFFDKSAITGIDYQQGPATAGKQTPNDLDSLISYLVGTARTSGDGKKSNVRAKHGEEDDW